MNVLFGDIYFNYLFNSFQNIISFKAHPIPTRPPAYTFVYKL